MNTQAPTFELRAAQAHDAAEIARLAAQLGYPTDAATMGERLVLLAADPRQCLRVASQGERLLGWIAAEQRLSLESGASVEIIGLIVDASAHRRGVGRHLVEAVRTWARAQGQVRIVVRSNVARAQSHPFYEGLGFRRSKTQHVYTQAA